MSWRLKAKIKQKWLQCKKGEERQNTPKATPREQQTTINATPKVRGMRILGLQHNGYLSSFFVGFQHQRLVEVLKIATGPIYMPKDMLALPARYKKPDMVIQTIPVPDDRDKEDNDNVYIPRKVLHELCQGKELDTIPMEIRELLVGTTVPTMPLEDIQPSMEEPHGATATEDQEQTSSQSLPHTGLLLHNQEVPQGITAESQLKEADLHEPLKDRNKDPGASKIRSLSRTNFQGAEIQPQCDFSKHKRIPRGRGKEILKDMR
jgi:hypothetical protein